MMYCQQEPDFQSCTVSCPDGLDFSGPVLAVYTCGKNTSYLWPHETPDNPRCVLPACTKTSVANEMKYAFHSTLELPCSSSADISDILLGEIQRKATDVTTRLPCIEDSTCSLDQALVNCCVQGASHLEGLSEQQAWVTGLSGTLCDGRSPSIRTRFRRNVKYQAHRGDSVLEPNRTFSSISPTSISENQRGTVEVKVVLVYRGERLSAEEDETSVERHGKLNQTTSELLDLARSLLNKTEAGELYVNFNGERIKVISEKVITSNSPVCIEGMMQSNDGFSCVECSPGSFFNSWLDTCTLCDVGFYQPRPAQSSCLECPTNYTTYGRGAMLELECYAEGTLPPEISEEEWSKLERDLRDSSLYHILPLTMISLLVLLTCLVVVVVIVKRK